MILFSYLLVLLELVRYSRGFHVSNQSHHTAFLVSDVVRRRSGYRTYSSIFDEEELRNINPPVPPPPPKKPAKYVLNDELSRFRYANFKDGSVDTRHVACLPYMDVRYQDKGALIPFRTVSEIVANYSNKILTLFSNFQEWTAAYNTDGKDVEDLSLYNPLSSGSYYAVVFYCAWQSESIALKRAIHQLCGRFSFVRDPPVNYGPKPREKLEDMIAKIEEVGRHHEEMIADARAKGLPDPPPPPLVEREQATLTMRSINADLTSKILDYLHDFYNFRLWMPKVGQLKFNKVLCKAYNELYNTSYKNVKSDISRHTYKLSDRVLRQPPPRWYLGNNETVPGNLTRINFIMVRLANSMMLSHSKRGLQRMRSGAHAHEKEMHFNEIIMRLLIDNKILYKDMPAIQLFKCVNPVDAIPGVYTGKRHDVLPINTVSPFYKPDPFAIASKTLYGLPPLRKCSHLAIPDDFKYLGTIMNISDLSTISSMDKLLPCGEESLAFDFCRMFKDSACRSGDFADDVQRLEPLLTTLELMYKMNFKQIVDARPVPVIYRYLNP